MRTLAPSYSARQAEKSPSPKPVRSIRLSQEAGTIWSVSTSARSRGTAVPVILRTGSIGALLVGRPGLEVGRCGEAPGDSGGGGDRGRDQVGASTGSLAAFEVAVGGGG